MKKTIYILSILIALLLASCENFNERNFPGYDEAATPSNIVNYEYTLTNADYNFISNEFLKIAVTSEDSVKAISISKNKYFIDSLQFKNGISSLLSQKYVYADTSSVAKISFKYNIPYDTTTINAADKYEIVSLDYTNMGLSVSNFSLKNATPNQFLPIWLKSKYPYAKSGSVKLIRYFYDNGNTPINIYKTYKIYILNNNEWKEYDSINLVAAKFTLNGNNWVYTRSDVFTETFMTTLGDFTSVQVSGTEASWVWGSYKGVGYAYANAYKKGAVVLWLLSPEIVLPDNENLVLSFRHAINYFTGTMDLKELTTLNISTDYSDDIESATWQRLDINYPETPSWNFINSGDISLKDFAKKKIRIGFRYETPETAQEAWEINNILIKEK